MKSIPDPASNPVSQWCNRILRTGYYLLFGLIPLLLTPWNYELFEYNKMIAVYIVTTLIVTSWIVKAISLKKLTIAKTPLDIPIALFFLSQLVSATFSMDPHVSWFGYYSRFNGGMWSVVSYMLLYYAFLSNTDVFPRQSIRSLLKTALIAGSIVAIYGVLERMGIDKHIWVQDVQNRVFSTLGQPNWLAAYLVALVPVTWVFVLKSQASNTKHQATNQKQHVLNFMNWNLNIVWNLELVIWCLLSILLFITLLFTRSRSGLLGFAVADVVFWGVTFRNFKRGPLAKLQGGPLRNSGRFFLILHTLLALIIFINGTGIASLDRWITFSGLKNTIQTRSSLQGESLKEATPAATATGPALETGGTESGVIRQYVWEGAVNAWKSSPKTMLIGTGTETFAFAFFQFRPAGHNQTSEWDFLYNKAHNEYLNYLATTGLFGLGSYLLFIGTFVIWFVTHQIARIKSQKPEPGAWYVRAALFAGWCSVLVTNFFGFSVVVTQLLLFIFPALVLALRHADDSKHRSIALRAPSWIAGATGAAGLLVIVRIITLWFADTSYAKGYQLDRSGQYAQANPHLIRANTLNPGEPLYHDELATNYSSFAVTALSAGMATQSANLANLAIAESDTALAISPNNVNFLKSRTRVLYTLSSLNPEYNTHAIDTLQQAALLSPNDPKIYYNLAILEGKKGNAETAVSYLMKAKGLKHDYRDPYNALWVFYTELKQPEEARAILEEYLTTVNPQDQQFRELLNTQ